MLTKEYIDKELLSGFLLKRQDDTNKRDYGHACLACGCDSMPGAASLATAAALKSGCGLVTLHTSAFAAQICSAANPSAILSVDPMPFFSDTSIRCSKYDTIAIGPGLGTNEATVNALRQILYQQHDAGAPVVLDADAINIIAANPDMLEIIPEDSVLTPHDGELSRLISWKDENDKSEKIQEFADRYYCHVVSKGYHTKIYCNCYDNYFENTTGNPGMAKGGSGDVLTGLIAGLIARGYASAEAAMLGTWIHGYAGDRCSEMYGMEAYSSNDLVEHLYLGFKELYLIGE